VFHFYLIDPVGRTVVRVNDGFDRAAELTNCEAPDLYTLWEDAAEPDSSVDIAYDPDAEHQPAFLLSLTHGSTTTERLVAGRAVLMACGAVPDDIAQQLSTAEAVQEAIGFVGKIRTDVAAWLKSGAPGTRAPARRSAAPSHARKPPSRHVRTALDGRPRSKKSQAS